MANEQTTEPSEFCEACLVWHNGPCPSPRVPEVRLKPGWLTRDIARAQKENHHG